MHTALPGIEGRCRIGPYSQVPYRKYEQQPLPFTSPNIEESCTWFAEYKTGSLYRAVPETMIFFRAIDDGSIPELSGTSKPKRPVIRITLDNVAVYDTTNEIGAFLLVHKAWDAYDMTLAKLWPPSEPYEAPTSYVGPVLTFLYGEELWQFVNLTECTYNPFEEVTRRRLPSKTLRK